jgi:hypothetical protein
MRRNRPRRPRRETVRRIVQLILPGLAWSLTPHFVPRCLPYPDDGPEPVEQPREPRPCILSRAERRTWAEIEAHYR